jgi:hypothetical protein
VNGNVLILSRGQEQLPRDYGSTAEGCGTINGMVWHGMLMCGEAATGSRIGPGACTSAA